MVQPKVRGLPAGTKLLSCPEARDRGPGRDLHPTGRSSHHRWGMGRLRGPDRGRVVSVSSHPFRCCPGRSSDKSLQMEKGHDHGLFGYSNPKEAELKAFPIPGTFIDLAVSRLKLGRSGTSLPIIRCLQSENSLSDSRVDPPPMPFTPLQKFREQPTLKQGRASTGRMAGLLYQLPGRRIGQPGQPLRPWVPVLPPGISPMRGGK